MQSNFLRTNTSTEVRIPQALRVAVILVVILLVAVPVIAQTAARIEGTVTDPTGAVVPNAKITATELKTHAVREVTANERGLFLITAVPPGMYTVTAIAPGFSKSVLHNLEVNVAGVVTADFKLTVGAASESVEVQASSVTVQTADSSVSRAITLKDINTLPQLGRNPIALAVFQPGVQVNPGDVSFSRINGTRQGSNNSTLDGIDVNDSVVPRLGLSMTANNTDSVGEFRIVTQGGKAEYGRSAGGQVEMITRSGTNNFHGNGYDYLRNTVLNANDYFNNQANPQVPRPKFIQNMFGGSFGGPIIKNKTFIFGNYQGRRTRQEVVRNRTVLTRDAKAGLFTYKDATGAIRTYNIVANDPRGLGIDPTMKSVLALLPDPNNCDRGDSLNTCGFRFNNPNNSKEDQYTIRADHNVWSANKLFLRFSWMKTFSVDSLNSADATFPGQPTGTQGGRRWGYSVGDDWTITSTLVNEFRYGKQRAGVAFNRPGRLPAPMVTSNLFTDPLNPAFAQGRVSPVNDLIDNLTKSWKNHIFKWGMKYSHTTQNGYNFAGIYPDIFTSTASSNAPLPPCSGTTPSSTCFVLPGGVPSSGARTNYQYLYNDLLGRMSSVALTFYSTDLATWQAAGSPRLRNHVLNEHGYYFQDDWKVTRNLTLNLGLRWELYLPPVESDGIQATLSNAADITATNKLTNLVVQRADNWYKTDWNNFAPRLGFAYDLRGDGKTSIRGNYGIFYDRIIGATTSAADGGTPGFSTSPSNLPQTWNAATIAANGCGSAPAGDVRISDCIPAPAQGAAPELTPQLKRATNATIFAPNLRTGYVQSFGLNVQHEILRNTVLEVGYVGSLGVKLFMQRDFNQPRVNEDFLNAFKELQVFNANNAALPPTTNTLVKLFTPVVYSKTAVAGIAPNANQPCSAQPNPVLCASTLAITSLGASNFLYTNNNVASAADTLDRSYYTLYKAAGVADTYLRNYPQFRGMRVGLNDGRSTYNALQLSLRRYMGDLRVAFNYTYSHSIDNISVDANGFTSPYDNFNIGTNKANGDADHRHSFNSMFMYTLPVGKGKMIGSNLPRWVDMVIGGWDLGSTIIVQDGSVFDVSSGRGTIGNPVTSTSANFTGDRHTGSIQYRSDGVYWFGPQVGSQISVPAAGMLGSLGRNGFRGPRYFNIDTSLVKKFKITESHFVTLRAEAYNLLNMPNFTSITTNIDNIGTTFGRLGGTTGPAGTSARNMQLSLRYDF